MNWFTNIWSNSSRSQIWFQALISFIVVTVMITWAVLNFSVEPKAFLPFDWTHIVLVLGSLGIVGIGNINIPQKQNEKDQNTGSVNS